MQPAKCKLMKQDRHIFLDSSLFKSFYSSTKICENVSTLLEEQREEKA